MDLDGKSQSLAESMKTAYKTVKEKIIRQQSQWNNRIVMLRRFDKNLISIKILKLDAFLLCVVHDNNVNNVMIKTINSVT